MEETQQVPNQNPLTPVPPIATYSAPQPTPASKTPWLLISLIVTLVGVASYFGYQNYNLKQQLVDQSPSLPSSAITNSPMSSASTVTTTDPTEKWKLYNNDIFVFRYPDIMPNIKLREKNFGEESSPNIYESSYLDPNQRGGGPGYTTMLRVIGPQPNPKGLSIEKWIDDQGLNTGGYGDQLPRTTKSIVVDSKSAILQTGTPAGFDSPTEFNLYIANDNNVYTLVYTIQTNQDEAIKYQDDFDQILSTFKFAK